MLVAVRPRPAREGPAVRAATALVLPLAQVRHPGLTRRHHEYRDILHLIQAQRLEASDQLPT